MNKVIPFVAALSVGVLATSTLLAQQQWGGDRSRSQSQMQNKTQDQNKARSQTQSQNGNRQMMGQLDKEQVRDAQRALNENGFNVGSADGIVGPRTRQGLRDFQRARGLQATGQFDQQTLSALGVEASEFSAGEFPSNGAGSSNGAMPRRDQNGGMGSNSGRTR